MYYVYIIESDSTSKVYVGYTKNYKARWTSHLHNVKKGVKNKLYDCMRKHGCSNFEMVLVNSFRTKDEALELEMLLIREITDSLNISPGGEGGFVVTDVATWKKKLSKARQGAKPALGMRHSEGNKKRFSEFGKMRWDKYGRYPHDIINLSFKDANKLYGISRTHYYRLLKQAKINDLS